MFWPNLWLMQVTFEPEMSKEPLRLYLGLTHERRQGVP